MVGGGATGGTGDGGTTCCHTEDPHDGKRKQTSEMSSDYSTRHHGLWVNTDTHTTHTLIHAISYKNFKNKCIMTMNVIV